MRNIIKPRYIMMSTNVGTFWKEEIANEHTWHSPKRMDTSVVIWTSNMWPAAITGS